MKKKDRKNRFRIKSGMIQNNLLLEIGCEEIPARFMDKLVLNFKKNAGEKLLTNRLSFKSLQAYGTPRRLVLFVEDLPKKQQDIVEEIKGPPKNIAYDQNGKFTNAANGFASKFGVSENNLFVKDNYLFAKVEKKGLPTDKVLTSLLPEIITSLYMPISMRWGDGDFKFIRPIHWIVALFGSKIIKFELAGIKSSNKTRGHRFLYKQKKLVIEKADISYYKSKLFKASVIVDQDERREKIRTLVKSKNNMALDYDDLLNEITYLIESPYVFECSFDKRFLSLPRKVLEAVMIKHQRYFPVVDVKNKIASDFIIVTNGCNAENVKDGNKRVITARLSDAKFFFDEDRKVPLKSRISGLRRVQFLAGLGDMEQKTERLRKLSHFIGKELKVDDKSLALIDRTAFLCKADLLTQMVFEFPELQGVMGKEYAMISGEEALVSLGIYEHYLPRFSEEGLPETVTGRVVSLADKIDTVCGCFGIGKIPSGSADPYGLRRAVNGIIRIIATNQTEILLDLVFDQSLKLYSSILKEVDFEKVYKKILEFIGVRLRGMLLELKYSQEVIDASFANLENISFVYRIATALDVYKREIWFSGIVATHDRVFRIASGAERSQIMEHDLVEEEEKNLYKLYLEVNWKVEDLLNKKADKKALIELSKLTLPVETFFEKILVMHEDERIKTNRLALLKSINNLFFKVADFRKMVLA